MFIKTLVGDYIINTKYIEHIWVDKNHNSGNYLIVAHLTDGSDYNLDEMSKRGRGVSELLSIWEDYLNGKTATRPY